MYSLVYVAINLFRRADSMQLFQKSYGERHGGMTCCFSCFSHVVFILPKFCSIEHSQRYIPPKALTITTCIQIVGAPLVVNGICSPQWTVQITCSCNRTLTRKYIPHIQRRPLSPWLFFGWGSPGRNIKEHIMRILRLPNTLWRGMTGPQKPNQQTFSAGIWKIRESKGIYRCCPSQC